VIKCTTVLLVACELLFTVDGLKDLSFYSCIEVSC